MSVITRNREILKRLLLGDSYEACAKDYRFTSISGVKTALRAALDRLREHTDIDILSTASLNYLMQHKETILEHLEKPYPKTDLLYNARRLLRKQFGKYYAGMPGEIAKCWDELKKETTSYKHRRELNSIKEWLIAEGYLIDDYINKEMLEFALDTLIEKIKDVDITKDTVLNVKPYNKFIFLFLIFLYYQWVYKILGIIAHVSCLLDPP